MWKGGPGNGKITVDTIIVWTLIAKDNGTQLNLEHIGFKEMKNLSIYSIMNEGWLKNIQRIAEFMNVVKHGTTHP